MPPEDGLERHSNRESKSWRDGAFHVWRSTDLLPVIARKVLFAYLLLVGLGAIVFLAWEIVQTREAISKRHGELHTATGKATSEALWTLNETLLESIVFGLNQDELITGAQIRTADGSKVFSSGRLTDAQSGQGSWLTSQYMSRWPIAWKSARGDELLGRLELETSDLVIRDRVYQRMLMILLFSTLALFALFTVSLIVIGAHVVHPISVLTRAMDRYELGKPADVAQRPVGEIGKLYDSFEVMQDRLRAAHGQLSAAADEMKLQLARQADELSILHKKNMKVGVSRAQEAERQRLMGEIHDGFGSELASARIAVERGNLSDAEIAAFLSRCSDDLYLVISVTGNEVGTFVEAIADWRYRVSRQLVGESFKLLWQVDLLDAPSISPRATLQILRIAQEALSNAIKHSQASEIRITVKYTAGIIFLNVSDNGNTFTHDQIPQFGNRGRGLASIKARARELGATLDITRDEGWSVSLVYSPEPMHQDNGRDERARAKQLS